MPPEPYSLSDAAIERVQQSYNLGKLEEVPEKRLELLRRWIAQAVSLLEKAQTPQPPAGPPMPPGMPPEAMMGMGLPPGPLGMPPGPPPGPMPPGPPLPPGPPGLPPPIGGAPPMGL